MTTHIQQLGQLKKYIEYLEDYYTNNDAPDLSVEMDLAVRQMDQIIGGFNSKFDYSEMILNKVFIAAKEFGGNSPSYEYGECSGINNILMDIDAQKITGELYIPLPGKPYRYEFMCVLENDDIDGPLHADYRINISITPYSDNPKPKYYTENRSVKYYKCSPFTNFEELLITACEEYTS